MACRRVWPVLTLLAVFVAGCLDIGTGGGGHGGGRGGGGGGGGAGGAVIPAAATVNVLAPGTVDDERFDGRKGGFFVGADGVARIAYLRVNDTDVSGTFDLAEGLVNDINQVMFSRRRSDGTWTAPIGVSAADGDFRENPVMTVVNTGVANINLAFLFWREVPAGGGVAEVHMARVNAGDPPLVLTPDTIITDTVVPSGAMIIGTSIGAVTPRSLVCSLDTADGSVYAAWGQLFGPGTADECVVAARYTTGGAGVGPTFEPNEKFAITPNNGAGGGRDLDVDAEPSVQLFFSPVPLVALGGGGTMHIVYVSTDVDGGNMAVRSRTRTGPDAWTSVFPEDDDILSDDNDVGVTGEFYRFPRIASEGDGDLFVAWTQGPGLRTTVAMHAYRTSGGPAFADDAVVFLPGPAPTGFGDLAITLDVSTPVVTYKRQNANGAAILAGGAVGSANVSGPFRSNAGGVLGAETVFHPATLPEAGEGPGRILMYRESSNRMAVVYDVPPAAAAPLDVFGVIRPGSAVFGAEANLTGTAAVVSRLAGGAGLDIITARFAFLEGPNAGPREVFSLTYSAGAYTVPALNISVSATDSKGGEAGAPFDAGNVGVFGTATPAAHIWFRERMGAAQHDIFFSRQ